MNDKLRRLKEIKDAKADNVIKSVLEEQHGHNRLIIEQAGEKTVDALKTVRVEIEELSQAITGSSATLADKLADMSADDRNLLAEKLERLAELSVKQLEREFPTEIKVVNIHDIARKFVVALEALSIPDNRPELESIAKGLDKLLKATTKEVKQSQAAADFIPYRRVIYYGRSFMFDDQPTPDSAGRGGGGAAAASSGGGDASAANQTTMITHLSQIEAAVEGPLPAGTNAIGKVVIEGAADGTGLTQSKTDALQATATAVKAGSGRVYGYHVYNPNATVAYLQFYNIAQGSVTVGTSTRTRTLAVPAGGVIDTTFAIPLSFDTAVTVAATTTITGSTNPTIGLLVNIDYI